MKMVIFVPIVCRVQQIFQNSQILQNSLLTTYEVCSKITYDTISNLLKRCRKRKNRSPL